MWVFWLSADSTANFEKGFAEIADKADIAAYYKGNKERLLTVKRWLEDESNGKWLIIVDNADDLSVLLPRPPAQPKKKSKDVVLQTGATQDLLAMLPQTTNGSYLITSRDREVAYQITGDYKSIIPVSEFEEGEAIDLLHKRLTEAPKDSDAKTLVKALDYIPLAISQAAAYIEQGRPRMTIPKFIEKVQRDDSDRARLLEFDIYDPRRDRHRSNSVIVTWHISIELIQATRPSAARLLALMSLFNRNGIPEDLLLGRYLGDTAHAQVVTPWRRKPRASARISIRKRTPKGPPLVSEHDFQEDWLLLHSFSLIKTDITGTHFSMHNLVQVSTRRWLELQGKLETWRYTYLGVMRETYPWPDLNNIEKCMALSPHVQAAIACGPSTKKSLLVWAYLLHYLAEYADIVGNQTACVEMNQAALRAFDALFGPEHADSLFVAHQVGLALYRVKAFGDAVATHRRVYKSREAKLGLYHRETFRSVRALGDALTAAGDEEEGREMWFLSMRIDEKLCSDQPDDAVMNLGGIAWGLTMQEKHREAEPVLRRLVEIQAKLHGTESLVYWDYQDRLGVNLQKQGRFRQAERIHRASAEAREEHFREENKGYLERYEVRARDPLWMKSMRYLAEALNAQNKYPEAELFYRKILSWEEAYLGKAAFLAEREVLETIEGLSNTLLQHGELVEAEKYARLLIQGREKDELDLASLFWAYRILGDVLQKKGDYPEALQWYQRALSGFEEKNGDHPDLPEIRQAHTSHLELMKKTASDEPDGEGAPGDSEKGAFEDGADKSNKEALSPLHRFYIQRNEVSAAANRELLVSFSNELSQVFGLGELQPDEKAYRIDDRDTTFHSQPAEAISV